MFYWSQNTNHSGVDLVKSVTQEADTEAQFMRSVFVLKLEKYLWDDRSGSLLSNLQFWFAVYVVLHR